MINPSIPLSARPVTLKSWSEAMDDAARRRANSQALAERDLDLQTRRQGQEDTAAINKALQEAAQPQPQAPAAAAPAGPALPQLQPGQAGPMTPANPQTLGALGQGQAGPQAPAQAQPTGGGETDYDDVIRRLEAAGQGTAAMALRKQVDEHLIKSIDRATKQLELAAKATEFAAQLASSATPENIEQVKATIAQFTGPGLAGALGEGFDPNRIRAVAQMGLSAKERFDADLKAMAAAHDAIKLRQQGVTGAVPGMPQGVNVPLNPDVIQKWRESVAWALSAASNNKDWESRRVTEKRLGAPQEVIDEFGTEWTPENQARAKQVAGGQTSYHVGEYMGPGGQTGVYAVDPKNPGAPPVQVPGLRPKPPVRGTGDDAEQQRVQERATRTLKANAERWKQTQLAKAEQLYREGQLDDTALQTEKLRIENSYREQIGTPPAERLGPEWGKSAGQPPPAPAAVPAPVAAPPAAPPASPAGAVPPTVAEAIKAAGKGPGVYTLRDGAGKTTKWRLKEDGTIEPAQ